MNNDGTDTATVGLLDALVIGVSSSGPSQTLAVSLAGLVAVSGYAGAIPIAICFLPMLGIAIAYQRLNRWDQSSGATYTWVARLFHPYLGFLCGWMILLYYTLGTTTLTIPAGIYTLELLAPSAVNDRGAIFAAGAGWNLAITLLAVRGLRAVARAEWLVVLFEYVVLGTAGVIAVRALLSGHAAVTASLDWFSWDAMGGLKGLMGGLLIACFMYSGWDASIYVHEQTGDRADAPGRAAVASVVLLAGMYVFTTLAFQGVLSREDLQAHAGNALSAIGRKLLPHPWDAAMALAVLLGTLASLQSAVVAASRMGLAMGRDGVMPPCFVKRSRSGVPWAATLAACLLNLALLALALAGRSIGAALTNAASSLGLISIIFYGITAAAALRQMRAGGEPFAGSLWPMLGLAFCLWVLVESLRSGAVTSVVLAYGLGSIGLGVVVAVLLDRAFAAPFFKRNGRSP